MKKSALLLLVAVPALFAFAGGDGAFPAFVKNKELYAKKDVRGEKFSELTFGTALHGAIPSAKDLKGKVLLIDFWATWCGPCRAVIPEMNEWQKKFGKDLVVVGVSDEKAETVKSFMEKTPMDYVVTTDPTKAMSKIIGVAGIPHVLVISKDGVVRYQGYPLQDEDRLTTEKLAQIIAANKKLK